MTSRTPPLGAASLQAVQDTETTHLDVLEPLGFALVVGVAVGQLDVERAPLLVESDTRGHPAPQQAEDQHNVYYLAQDHGTRNVLWHCNERKISPFCDRSKQH